MKWKNTCGGFFFGFFFLGGGERERETDRQTDKKTGRQTDRQTEKGGGGVKAKSCLFKSLRP